MLEIARERAQSILKPHTFSHGTLECKDLEKSRRFYRDFLGLETVRHVEKPVIMIRLGSDLHVVCVEVGEAIHEQHVFNHWGLNVSSREEVDRSHALALKYQEEFEIKKVLKTRELHGDYSFYLQDLDGNWWEIQCLEGPTYDENFARGDIV